MRELVDQAAQRQDKVVAIVKSAVPLTDEQTDRLVGALSRIYRRQVAVHVEVEPALIGGISVQVGDEVIDGSVAGRLESLNAGWPADFCRTARIVASSTTARPDSEQTSRTADR